VLGEGRYYRNPYTWYWVTVRQPEVPEGKLGVRIRLFGDNLPPGYLIGWDENQKGIAPEVLRPGRYPINAKVIGAQAEPRKYDSYAEVIELHDPVTVPAGFKGVVTNLSAQMPKDTNLLLVEEGKRGAQQKALDPATYYVNPYVTRIDLVDCRSQRFNLSEEGDLGFPSKDGFWVSLDGVVEFRVIPEEAAKVFVVYNDATNQERGYDPIHEEIVKKIILPNARAFCRLEGSNHSGREFIQGDTRVKFQKEFQTELAATCKEQGIEIIQALITKIRPPQKIAAPVKDRQIALQTETQYERQIEQQESEQGLAKEKAMVLQKKALVEAAQEVVKLVVDANRKQEVEVIAANQRLKVAEKELLAAKDEAEAILSLGKADADVIRFDNEAVAAGWQKSIEAFSGDGGKFANWTLKKKLAPAYKALMVNTNDSSLMEIFKSFNSNKPATPQQ
jgi:regulator of protease activity HflC (stomatin/prohibitin superfamily)